MFDVYDPRRSRIYLTEHRYYTHIRRRHPEMDRVEYIEETVTDPTSSRVTPHSNL